MVGAAGAAAGWLSVAPSVAAAGGTVTVVVPLAKLGLKLPELGTRLMSVAWVPMVAAVCVAV